MSYLLLFLPFLLYFKCFRVEPSSSDLAANSKPDSDWDYYSGDSVGDARLRLSLSLSLAWELLSLFAFVPSLPVLLAFLCKLLASSLVATLLRFCTSFASVCALFCFALPRLLVYLLISLLLLLLALQLTCLYFPCLARLLLLHFLHNTCLHTCLATMHAF